MTTSSKAVFPARSPIPLMVHSIWRAPFCTPAMALAVANPKSLWQWQEMVTLWMTLSHFYLSKKFKVFCAIFIGQTVACGVWNIQNGGTGFYHLFANFGQKFIAGPSGIFCVKFHIFNIVFWRKKRPGWHVQLFYPGLS